MTVVKSYDRICLANKAKSFTAFIGYFTSRSLKTVQIEKENFMKSTGIVRNIDELGRIVVPKEMRTKMNIKNSDPVEMYVEGDKIILQKYHVCCSLCSSSDALIDFKGKKICSACLDELKNI